MGNGEHQQMLGVLFRTGNRLGALIGVVLIGTALWVAAFGVFNDIYLRVGGLLLAVLILVLTTRTEADRSWAALTISGIALTALVLAIGRFFIVSEEVETGLYFLEPIDIWLAAAGIIGVLILTYRQVGGAMAIVCAVAIGYGVFGHHLPGVIAHAGADLDQLATTLWYSFDGAFGRPMSVVTQTILVFIVFGGLLEAIGIDKVLVKLAFAATAKTRGGPALAAVFASALFGTISGSAVANVVGTGVLTIPLIKRRGFSPRFAAAVEATASTGGQIMPPIMGAVAFIMADITGISYLTICLAALIPAFVFYFSLFATVHFAAETIPAYEQHEKLNLGAREWALAGVFAAALFAIVWAMIDGSSPARAGLYGCGVAFVLGMAVNKNAWSFDQWRDALARTAHVCAILILIVAAVGLVVGVLNMTGVGLRFASAIRILAGEALILSLILMAAACLVLGMGMPTVPAYLMIVLVMGPATQKLGVELMAMHLFVLYFGVLSAVTPPVALAAFAAAPIAGAKAMSSGWESCRLALSGFIMPFAFVFRPELLLRADGDWLATALATLAALFAAVLVSASTMRFGRVPLWRVVLDLVVAMAALFVTGPVSYLALIVAGILVFAELKNIGIKPAPQLQQKT